MEESSVQQKTYLLDDIEVVMTGRVAKRKLRNNKVDERIEIKPEFLEDGSWKRWVRKTDLYEIEKDNNEVLP